ncbi:MAG: RNA ligase family protein, partial [bacterium]|nr:RNA ligase family protein [bacterium]
VAVEPKLDGFRTQIHIWRERGSKRVALFSRNLENTTAMFPEIAAAAKRLRVRSAILDGEAIGFNSKTGRYAPFQETAQRKRKHDIEAFAKKIPLVVLVFDVLYLNGRSLLALPQAERRNILVKLIGERARDKILKVDPQVITNDPAVIARELRVNVKKGLEGLVVKNLASPYQAGSRGFHWIKLKANTAALQRLRSGGPPAGRAGPPAARLPVGQGRAGQGKKTKLPDTIDALVMGIYRGRGKRAAFGIGGFLLGVRGADDRYYSLSRLGSGLSDAQFREAKERVKKLRAPDAPKEYVVRKDGEPDIWVRPELVVEILADEISRSSRHTAGAPRSRFGGAGAKAGGRGYSLRFPRLVRFRDDKNPEDATTVAEIAKMERSQAKR